MSSIISELNNARIESDSSIDSERHVPTVDRSLKAKMILRGSKKEMKDVIEAEQDLVSNNLKSKLNLCRLAINGKMFQSRFNYYPHF
jgi:hypothetical protein